MLRTSTADCRSKLTRVVDLVESESDEFEEPDVVGANGRNAARENAEPMKNRWKGITSVMQNTRDAGRNILWDVLARFSVHENQQQLTLASKSSPRDDFDFITPWCTVQSSFAIAFGCVDSEERDVGLGIAGRERGR